MMRGKINTRNGLLILDQISFKVMFSKRVHKHDKEGKQGRIVLPSELIGKTVLVIIPEEAVHV